MAGRGNTKTIARYLLLTKLALNKNRRTAARVKQIVLKVSILTVQSLGGDHKSPCR